MDTKGFNKPVSAEDTTLLYADLTHCGLWDFNEF